MYFKGIKVCGLRYFKGILRYFGATRYFKGILKVFAWQYLKVFSRYFKGIFRYFKGSWTYARVFQGKRGSSRRWQQPMRIILYLKLETWNLKLETWNLKLETWNLKLETWNMELETWNLKLIIGFFLQNI